MDNKDFKKNSNLKVILVVVGIVIAIILIRQKITSSSKENKVSSNQYKDSYQDSLDAVKKIRQENLEQKEFQNRTEAETAELKQNIGYKIWEEHGGEWNIKDCNKIARKQTWVGMKVEQILYVLGTPNVWNTTETREGSLVKLAWRDSRTIAYFETSAPAKEYYRSNTITKIETY